MHLGFFCLFFLLNFISDIFSLFIGIILSTNLLTELDTDRLGIYNTRFQYFIRSFTGLLHDVMPVSVVLWRVRIRLFNVMFFYF